MDIFRSTAALITVLLCTVCSPGWTESVPAAAGLAATAELPPGAALDDRGRPFIFDVAAFLESCPQSDPAVSTIRADFSIRRNGVVLGEIPCTEPISKIPIADLTDQLILLQGLRVMFYMDQSQSGIYPWTNGTLYSWVKTKIGGIDIDDTTSYSFCCRQYDGQTYIVLHAQDEGNRDFDRQFRGIAGNISLYAHEVRHVDGYPHITCPGTTSGADDWDFDENDLTTRGVQWWLDQLWLNGIINVGFGCAPKTTVQETANWFLQGANHQYRRRFCNIMPPELALPKSPGGPCVPVVTKAAIRQDALRLQGNNFKKRSRVVAFNRVWRASLVNRRLVVPRLGSRIKRGTAATVKVRNPGGSFSPEFTVRRR